MPLDGEIRTDSFLGTVEVYRADGRVWVSLSRSENLKWIYFNDVGLSEWGIPDE